MQLRQLDQPFHEVDARALERGLARALGPSGRDGGELCRSSTLSGHSLQSQRLVEAGRDRGLCARGPGPGLLRGAWSAQATLGAGTLQRSSKEIACGQTAAS